MVGDGSTSHNRICNNLKSDQMSGLKFFICKDCLYKIHKLLFLTSKIDNRELQLQNHKSSTSGQHQANNN